ncbi:hypothetical protein BC332_08100 [Capsicum chinense]|nr:hypothetical protein BC332_08100 [Capsicum chinense]
MLKLKRENIVGWIRLREVVGLFWVGPMEWVIGERNGLVRGVSGEWAEKVFGLLWVSTWSDSNTWEDALSFKPERFPDSNVDFRGHDFEFTPFGAGRRICPGLSFARQKTHLILASLIHHFECSLPNGEDPMKLNMEEKFGVTPQKEKPLLVVPV